MRADQSEDSLICSINIAPLVDVSLVLVIIFMITMPFVLEKSLRVSHSQEQIVEVSSVTEPILVEISLKGIRVEGKNIPDAELQNVLRRLFTTRNVSAVAVSAVRRISHGRVVQVLDQALGAGAKELNLLEPPVGNDRR